MKIGVIIQGPLITFGDGPNNVVDGFDAIQTISKNIKILDSLNIDYVISSWKPKTSEKNYISKLEKITKKIILNSSPNIVDPYNAYKQHLSIHFGFQELVKKQCDYIVKIRTDMLIPIEFWKWLRSIESSNIKKLLVSELYLHHPFYLGDFIIGGDINTYKKYLISIIEQKNKVYFPLSAFDDGFKYAAKTNSLKYNTHIPSWFNTIMLVIFKPTYVLDSWNTFLNQHIVVVPFPIWKNIIWRDKNITEVISPKKFIFSSSPQFVKNNFFYTVTLIFFGYLRLWNKINKDTNSPLFSFSEKIYSYLSTANGLFSQLLNSFRKPIILGRFACIGKDVLYLKRFKTNHTVINMQKMRVDLFLESIHKDSLSDYGQLEKFFIRKDVFPLVKEQNDFSWLKQKNQINCFLMDSFSELTDKKFTHKNEGWSFAAHYSDIAHSDEFEQLYRCDGLLPEELFYSVYLDFFNWFENYFPDVPVFFIHTPTKLDSRQLYKSRAKKILSVMKKIALEKSFITNISINGNEVEHNPEDSFPYHFSSKTYFAFVKEWNTMVKNR